jgi:SWI/SNF-related matrix-associated actin-dependent regulator 1 of chromatin subfamily A
MTAAIVLQAGPSGFFVKFPAPCAERFTVKEAGFRFRDGAWYGADLEAAKLAAMPGVAVTEEAKARLETSQRAMIVRLEQEQRNREASRHAAADVEVPAPAGLDYLPYQKAGIAFAADKPGVLIGDEMGLGKTIQAIGIVNARPDVRSVLIICPASLKTNWRRECEKWLARPMSVAVANGTFPEADVVIVNYDVVKKHRAAIDARPWDLLVCDEAHYLKNPKAARTKAVLGGDKGADAVEPIKAGQRVLLTGTPIVNRPVELWPLVHALDPQGLGADFFGFARRYCGARRNSFGWDFTGASHLDELQDRLRGSIMVRRLKSDVLKELPAKRRQLVPVEAKGALAKVAGRMDAAWERSEAEAERLRAMAEMAKAEGGESYKRAVENLRSHQRAAFAELSRIRHELALAKVPAVVEHAKDLLETADKLVVMVHHQDVAQQVHDELHAAGFGPVMVHGAVSLDQRQRAVDAFQTLPAVRVFIGTIRAAGVGLTLTASSTVLFGELDWVPGNVSQAEDRCHRIGQTNSVLVQHLVVDGSLDARLAQVLVDKQAVIDAAMDDASAPREMADEASLDVDSLMVVEAPVDEPQVDEPKTAPNSGRAGTTSPQERTEERNARRADRKVAQRAATSGVSRDVLVKEGIDMTDEQRAVAQQAVRRLAAHDPDAAMLRNDVGFSKADVFLGHALAQLSEPKPAHYAMMRRLVLRYRKTQLAADEAAILA